MLKKILKFLLRLLFILILVVFIAISSFIYYLENSIDKEMDEKDQKELIAFINNSPELPPSFYKVYNKYYPNALETGVWKYLFYRIEEIYLWHKDGENICPCAQIYYCPGLVKYKSYSRFSPYIIAMEVEEHCKQKKCLEFEMSTAGYGLNIRGIQEAACHFYHMELDELTEQEILELIIIPNAPRHFSPTWNRANLDKAVAKLKAGRPGKP